MQIGITDEDDCGELNEERCHPNNVLVVATNISTYLRMWVYLYVSTAKLLNFNKDISICISFS